MIAAWSSWRLAGVSPPDSPDCSPQPHGHERAHVGEAELSLPLPAETFLTRGRPRQQHSLCSYRPWWKD